MTVPLVLDWDGTVTETDTLHMTIERFGDLDVFRAMEAEIDAVAAAPLGLAQITFGIVGAYMDFRFPDPPLECTSAITISDSSMRLPWRGSSQSRRGRC